MIKIQEGCPTAEAWLTLRRAVGFAPYPLEAAERGLQHTLKCFCALDQEDRMVGLVKLQGDGVTSFLVHDRASRLAGERGRRHAFGAGAGIYQSFQNAGSQCLPFVGCRQGTIL